MKNYFDLSGQVAVITGCSTGLGVQMAEALANQGCNIVCLARRKEKVDANAEMLKEKYGVKAIGVVCDVTDTDGIAAAVDEIMKEFGRIDILINNAGTGGVVPAEEMPDEVFLNEVNIDLTGTFKMSRAIAAKAMIPGDTDVSSTSLPCTALLVTRSLHLLHTMQQRAVLST